MLDLANRALIIQSIGELMDDNTELCNTVAYSLVWELMGTDPIYNHIDDDNIVQVVEAYRRLLECHTDDRPECQQDTIRRTGCVAHYIHAARFTNVACGVAIEQGMQLGFTQEEMLALILFCGWM
jgi:hypothetical protein